MSRTNPPIEVIKQYGKRTYELQKDGAPILHEAARESNADIFRFLLDSVQAGGHRDTIIELSIAQGDDSKPSGTWQHGGATYRQYRNYWSVLTRN